MNQELNKLEKIINKLDKFSELAIELQDEILEWSHQFNERSDAEKYLKEKNISQKLLDLMVFDTRRDLDLLIVLIAKIKKEFKSKDNK